MLGGHKSYKEIQSRKRNSQSGMSKDTGWDLIFSMVLRGDLLEKVTFTRDLKLGRTGTTWISWGAPRGTASTGPLLYPPPLTTSLRCTVPALFPVPLLALQCEHQNTRGQSALSGGALGVETMNGLSWVLPKIWEAIASNLHSHPRKKDHDLILHGKKLRLTR